MKGMLNVKPNHNEYRMKVCERGLDREVKRCGAGLGVVCSNTQESVNAEGFCVPTRARGLSLSLSLSLSLWESLHGFLQDQEGKL